MPPRRALRLLGYTLCLVIPVSRVIDWATDHEAVPPGWIAAYGLFVLAFHVGASAPEGAEGQRRRGFALLAQEIAVVAMAVVSPCQFASLALVVTALLASMFLGPRALAGLLGVQTVVVSALVMRGCGVWSSLSWLLVVAGFQAAVTVAVLLARRETSARQDLLRAHVELRATRALLAEATRSDERHRIARELHDLLGHNLTALGLHVEAARSVTPDKVPFHLDKVGTLATTALSDVRGAVGAMRDAGAADLGRALRALCCDVPGLRVHLDVPEPLLLDCPERAHCVVRCVQEILTNTLRHAQAENLWLRVEQDGTSLSVDARDDGHGVLDLHVGNGLRGMRERIEELGGRLAVAATPAFSVRALLPLDRGAS